MSVDKLVDSTQLDSDLTSVANAIRTKGGTSAQLAFPAGFVSAIQAIPSGSGYSTKEIVTRTVENTVFDLEDGEVAINYAFNGSNITTLKSSATRIVKSVSTATEAFANCTSLAVLDFPNVTIAGGLRIFSGCTSLVNVVFPSCGALDSDSMFQNCSSLKRVDLGSPTVTAARVLNGKNIFLNDSAFDTLVLRQNSVGALYNINAFAGTPFASGGTGGTLYVPSSLISFYQSASNWSTILGYANNQIKSIESTHTDPNAPIDLTLYYADGTPIST